MALTGYFSKYFTDYFDIVGLLDAGRARRRKYLYDLEQFLLAQYAAKKAELRKAAAIRAKPAKRVARKTVSKPAEPKAPEPFLAEAPQAVHEEVDRSEQRMRRLELASILRELQRVRATKAKQEARDKPKPRVWTDAESAEALLWMLVNFERAVQVDDETAAAALMVMLH
jgi:hypothetical protein